MAIQDTTAQCGSVSLDPIRRFDSEGICIPEKWNGQEDPEICFADGGKPKK